MLSSMTASASSAIGSPPVVASLAAADEPDGVSGLAAGPSAPTCAASTCASWGWELSGCELWPGDVDVELGGVDVVLVVLVLDVVLVVDVLLVVLDVVLVVDVVLVGGVTIGATSWGPYGDRPNARIA